MVLKKEPIAMNFCDLASMKFTAPWYHLLLRMPEQDVLSRKMKGIVLYDSSFTSFPFRVREPPGNIAHKQRTTNVNVDQLRSA